MTKNDKNMSRIALEAMEERLDMMEKDVEGLKSQVKLADTYKRKIESLSTDISEHYYDLNNKIASIRGLLVSSAKKPRPEPFEATTTMYPNEIDMMKALGFSQKDMDKFYMVKAAIEQQDKAKKDHEGTKEKGAEVTPVP